MKKREKSAVISLVANIYRNVISSVMPFIVRTVLIRYIGIEYLGVNGLFASILQVINIIDAGFAALFSFYLYKPANDNDYDVMNAIMNLTRRVFWGFGILTFIICLFFIMPFLPYFVKDSAYPEDINIYFVFGAYVLNAVLSYFVLYVSVPFAPLLLSHIEAFVWGTAFLFMYSVQIICIVCFKDFFIYSVSMLSLFIPLAGLFQYFKHKKMPWLDYKGAVPDGFFGDIKKRLVALYVSKIRNISRNSLDSIIISCFMGLEVLAKFQNYYQVMLVPVMLIGIINASIQPSIGNGISAETTDSNYGVLKQYTFILNFAATVFTNCLLTLIQPFMKLWIGFDYLLGMDIVICVGIYFYVLSISGICIVLRDTTGTWEHGKWIPVVETAANLILNIVMIQWLGLLGIILASIITVAFINIPFEFKYIFKYYYKGGFRDYLYIIIKDTIISVVIVGVSYMICINVAITNYFLMAIRCIMALVVPILLFLLIHCKDEEFGETIRLIDKIITVVKKRFFIRG